MVDHRCHDHSIVNLQLVRAGEVDGIIKGFLVRDRHLRGSPPTSYRLSSLARRAPAAPDEHIMKFRKTLKRNDKPGARPVDIAQQRSARRGLESISRHPCDPRGVNENVGIDGDAGQRVISS